jgi:myo-inositol-1(or 4)-monophosphatase
MTHIPSIEAVKATVAGAAKEILLPGFARSARHWKADGSVVTEADFAMQARLATELAVLAPGVPMLGEEMDAEQQREALEAGRNGFWCLDPVDGTSNFAGGLPFFSVSLAFVVDRRPVMGIVYDVVRDECFHAVAGQGAWLNDSSLDRHAASIPLRQALAAVDFKRIGPLAEALVQHPPYRSQRYFGSSALEWCWLAAGRFQVYLHGLQNPWDYAAGLLVLQEAGGRAATLEGGEILPLDLKPRPVVAALDPELFQEWRNWLAAASAV